MKEACEDSWEERGVKDSHVKLICHQGEIWGDRVLLEAKAVEVPVTFQLQAAENLGRVDPEGGKGIL